MVDSSRKGGSRNENDRCVNRSAMKLLPAEAGRFDIV